MTLQDTIGEGGRRGADSRGVREDSLERWSSDTGGQAYQAERQRIFPFEGGQGKSEEVIGALSQLEFGSHHFCKREPPTVSEKGDDASSVNLHFFGGVESEEAELEGKEAFRLQHQSKHQGNI